MGITKAISDSEILDQEPNNGDENIRTLKRRGNSYQSAYKAGLASGKEQGYRRGYREGFTDCIKLDNPTRNLSAMRSMSAGASKKAAGSNAIRLKGLPCANCGCPSYSDEVKCTRCGTSLIASVGEQPSALKEFQPSRLCKRQMPTS
jgi:hypothetical protein